jgi:hypothetical protein
MSELTEKAKEEIRTFERPSVSTSKELLDRVEQLEREKENAIQQAKIQTCELNTQKGIIQVIQDKFNLRVYDFNLESALDLALAQHDKEVAIKAIEDFIEFAEKETRQFVNKNTCGGLTAATTSEQQDYIANKIREYIEQLKDN